MYDDVVACVDRRDVIELDGKELDVYKRFKVMSPTVGDVIAYLSGMDLSARVCVGGYNQVYFHVSRDGSVIDLESSPLYEVYGWPEGYAVESIELQKADYASEDCNLNDLLKVLYR